MATQKAKYGSNRTEFPNVTCCIENIQTMPSVEVPSYIMSKKIKLCKLL